MCIACLRMDCWLTASINFSGALVSDINPIDKYDIFTVIAQISDRKRSHPTLELKMATRIICSYANLLNPK